MDGPIGATRADYHAALIAMHAGAPYEEGAEPELTDFLLFNRGPDTDTE